MSLSRQLQSDLDFDDDVFPLAPGTATRWAETCMTGFERMAGLKVVIGGCARDLGRWVFPTVTRLSWLMTFFEDARVVIYENDSADGTRQVLDAWAAADSRITILGDRLGDPVNPTNRCLNRAQRMANYRNAVRNHIVSYFANYEYTIIADLDLHAGWSVRGIANTFGQRPDWDFVGSNGVMFRYRHWLQYDAWAYREQGSYQALQAQYVNGLSFPRGASLVPVFSCFGGLGIYSTTALARAAYDGTDCEHVALHRKMRHNGFGRTYLNPSQIVCY